MRKIIFTLSTSFKLYRWRWAPAQGIGCSLKCNYKSSTRMGTVYSTDIKEMDSVCLISIQLFLRSSSNCSCFWILFYQDFVNTQDAFKATFQHASICIHKLSADANFRGRQGTTHNSKMHYYLQQRISLRKLILTRFMIRSVASLVKLLSFISRYIQILCVAHQKHA